eukprot:g3747.t1
MRQLQITVKNAKVGLVLAALEGEAVIPMCENMVHFEGATHTLVLLKCKEKHLHPLLDALAQAGVGDRFGCVDVLQVTMTKPLKRSLKFDAWKRRKYTTGGRVPVEEIYEIIDADSHLTFNFVALTVCAALIAGLGLASDSDATVVASMLVSPLMNPILLLTFGGATGDREFIMRGLKNEAIGILITICSGVLIGICIAQLYGPDCEHYSPTGWCYGKLRSSEMISRGTPINLVPGFFVAMPAGASVAVAITAGGANAAFAGVAIAVALLPPLVNSGMCFGLALVYWLQPRGDFPGGASEEEQQYFAWIALYSFCLFMLNMVCIFISAFSVFKLKKVDVLPARSNRWAEHSKSISRRLQSQSQPSGLGRLPGLLPLSRARATSNGSLAGDARPPSPARSEDGALLQEESDTEGAAPAPRAAPLSARGDFERRSVGDARGPSSHARMLNADLRAASEGSHAADDAEPLKQRLI